ncbi:MAG: hypothetical protein WAR21_00175 [Candidatus Acidiferrales bacterium]
MAHGSKRAAQNSFSVGTAFGSVVMDYGTAAAATPVRLIFDNNPELRAKLKEASSVGTMQAEQFLHPWFAAALHLVQYPQ